MIKRFILLFIFIFIFFGILSKYNISNFKNPEQKFGAATWNDNFESYSTGDLNGQGDWSGDATYDVQTSVVYEGSKAASGSGSEGLILKSFDGLTSGSLYFAIRTSSVTTDGVYLRLYEGSTNIMGVGLGYPSGKTSYYSGGWQTYGNASSDTWYIYNIEFDDTNQNDKFRMRVYASGSWGAFTDWVNTKAGYSSINNVGLQAYDTTGYFDILSSSDPTAAVEELKYINSIIIFD